MCTLGKLNKSCSESDLYKVNFDDSSVQDPSCGVDKRFPLMRKRVLFVEQIIYGDSHSMLRSASCNLVLDGSHPNQSHSLNNFAVNNTVFNNFFNDYEKSTVNQNTSQNIQKVDENDVTNDGTMPMEVDIVCNDQIVEDHLDFVETMDAKVTEEATQKLENKSDNLGKYYLKKRSTGRDSKENIIYQQPLTGKKSFDLSSTKLIPITSRPKQKSFQCGYFILISIIVAITILLYMLRFESDFTLYVNSDIQSQNIHKDLLEQVYEQKVPISVVVRSLKDRTHWQSKTKVLAFVGPPGVGKTFLATIIKKHFDQRLIHELYGMHVSYKIEWDHILNNLKDCCLNLIIIDDLKILDNTDLFALIHSLPKNQFNLVIAIFNIAYTNENLDYTITYQDIVGVRNEFDHSGLYHEIVVFREFSTEQAKDWLEKQLDTKNVDSNLKKTIVRNILEGHDVKQKGLKGLYSKMLLELEQCSH